MENRDLFGKTFECTCGKTHVIEPSQVVYSPDATDRLGEACARAAAGRRAAVLMDVRTREVAGSAGSRSLAAAGWEVTELLLSDSPAGGWPVCDDVTQQALARRLGRPDLIVPVGSGVISDMGKWLALERGLPYVSFATAASMNGYASANIAPTIRGVKSLVYARPPVAVLSSPTVLRDAPYEMTAAGLGDVLAKSVSAADWYLNRLLFGDFYCERAVGLIADIEPMYLDHPERLPERSDEAVEALFYALLLTGVAMTMADTSAPSSGGEHLISHSLDMMSSVDGADHDLHGRQVGVGTILASELYRRVLATESPRLTEPVGEVDRPFWGPLAGVVAEQYAQKLDRLAQAREKLSRPGAWDRLREALSPRVRPPQTVRECLRRAGGAFRAEQLGCGRDRLLAALLHAHEIRSRFTVLDLARLVGVMPAAADEIVQQWA